MLYIMKWPSFNKFKNFINNKKDYLSMLNSIAKGESLFDKIHVHVIHIRYGYTIEFWGYNSRGKATSISLSDFLVLDYDEACRLKDHIAGFVDGCPNLTWMSPEDCARFNTRLHRDRFPI